MCHDCELVGSEVEFDPVGSGIQVRARLLQLVEYRVEQVRNSRLHTAIADRRQDEEALIDKR